MIRRVHPHESEGCGLRPASDEGTGPKRSEETGDEERQHLNRTTRTNAASRITRGTSEESTVGAKRRNRGRRATESRWIHCDHVHLVNLTASDEVPGRSEATKPGTRSDLMRTEKDPKGQPSKTRPGGLGRGLPRREKFTPGR